MIDTQAIKEHIRGIIMALGDDPQREGLIETPDRVARMYEEVFEGMNYTNDDIAQMYGKTFEKPKQNALMYNMKVTVAYIPKDKIIGLSKIARIADMVAKRLQVQERIGSDIAEIMQKVTGSEDIAVLIEANHSCMTARGIKNAEAKTFTSKLCGRFKIEPELYNRVKQ